MDELDKLNKQVLEAMGWKFGMCYAYNPAGEMRWYAPNGDTFLPGEVPWPTSDIGDAWELENDIPESEQSTYSALLWKIVFEDCMKKSFANFIFSFAHATPEQRSRAYLAWKERSHANQ